VEPEAFDRPAVLDELASALAKVPPVGAWVELAACGSLPGVDEWTADHPDAEELALAVRVCRHCRVRQECAGYAAEAPVWGLWAGEWHGRHGRPVPAA
jgi:hypothetical protein